MVSCAFSAHERFLCQSLLSTPAGCMDSQLRGTDNNKKKNIKNCILVNAVSPEMKPSAASPLEEAAAEVDATPAAVVDSAPVPEPSAAAAPDDGAAAAEATAAVAVDSSTAAAPDDDAAVDADFLAAEYKQINCT
eukprot:GHVU01064783.1.p3 GENE.GHVU01064783.1~~GHVU01064783.1.p3  ORF type:complete len:135 (-),score=22.55 GHVU01064783.1:175-579(-)